MAERETVIGAETRISGEIRGEEDLVIKGHVDGKIQLTQTLTVDKNGIVQADVDVRQLVVAGTLVGNIVASESVRLLATARVVGDLASPRVMMEAGAAYRGRVDMGDVDAARAAVASRSVAQPASSSRTVAAEATKERPAPPRVAPPPRTAVVATKAAPKFVAPASPRVAEVAPAVPPAFPRVTGTVGSAAPAWAKKKIRRR
jgi:cytoskeletal protein CcmA (bactofilin family)